jgi:hypothetical protein
MFLDEKAHGEPYQAPTDTMPVRFIVGILCSVAAAAFCGNMARGYDLSTIDGPALMWWGGFKMFIALAGAILLVALLRRKG